MKKIFGFISSMIISYSFSQTIVTTNPENKKVILEEYTGIHCTYCPDGHEIAQSLKNQYPWKYKIYSIY